MEYGVWREEERKTKQHEISFSMYSLLGGREKDEMKRNFWDLNA